ncbi:ABC transporter ATP-binding protein/permease [Myxococcota bacterium]|nr:ABC transporter ATP-binding protein/permease [Myxococcota bacterium]
MSEFSKVRRGDLRIFWRRIKPFVLLEKKAYSLASVFEVLSLTTVIVYPWLVGLIVDDGIENGSMGRLNDLVMILAGVLIVQSVSTYMRSYLFTMASERMMIALRKWIFGNVIVQEMAFFDDEGVGNLTTRVNADVTLLGNMMRIMIPEVIHFGLMGSIAGALMVYTSPMLAAIVLLVGPAMWYGASRLGARLRRFGEQTQTMNAKVYHTALEAFSGIQAVKTFRAEEREVEEYSQVSEEVVGVAKRYARAYGMLEAANNFISEGAIVLTLWAGGALIVSGNLTAGALVTFVLYAGMVTRSVRNVSTASADVMRAEGATQVVFSWGERQSQMPEEGELVPDGVDGRISLEGVHFRYPSRPDSPVLGGVDLEIPRGQVLALVGASGSGKSTVTKLIARFYEPSQGHVRLDGRELGEYDANWLRKQITLVPAEAMLFARSVAENIRYGRPMASDGEIEEAARVAFVAGFIQDFPDRYETEVGDQGRLFSSGQRQRIAIARSVLVGAKVLILDEATAALDSEGEAIVKEGLRKLPQGPTIVMISHRLSTVMDADRVVVMKDGQIVGEGTHEELLASSDIYRDLVEKQLLTL